MENTISMELRKFVAPEIIEGLGARLLIERYISHFLSIKPMIVTDKNVSQLSWFKEIIELIGSKVDTYVIFDQVTPNPRDYEAMKGAEIFIEEKCDLIIAIGGGSPIDCAKCISIVSTNGGHILDYAGVDEVDLPGPPLVCIPTTAGTAADISQFAIVLDTKDLTKKAIISKKIVPDLALIDPLPLMDMDPYLRACTGMDALTHAIEAYVSNAQSPLTDVHALKAIELINENIIKTNEEESLEIMYNLMIGSLQAGLAFSNASLGLVHGMAHSLGGLFDLAHGECNAILLKHVIEFNFYEAVEKYKIIARNMGIETEGKADEYIKDKLISRVDFLCKELGIKEKYSLSYTDKEMELLIENVMEDPCIITNPREITTKEVRKIYEQIIQRRE